MKSILPILALVLSIAVPSNAQTVTGSGGTFVNPPQIGGIIAIGPVTLTNAQTEQTASVACVIDSFVPSTYEWYWTCSHGILMIDGVNVAAVSGKVTLTCQGGGRGRPVICWHIFTGTATDPEGDVGALTASAKSGPNTPLKVAVGTITAFSASF
jgi:hypothetical protein